MLKINFKPETKNKILIIVRDAFLAFYFLFAAFAVMEIIKPRLVTAYLNLNIFMFGLIILGIITIYYFQSENKEPKSLNFMDYSTIILFSVLIGVFASYLTRQIGYVAILVGIISFIVSAYFIILTYKE